MGWFLRIPAGLIHLALGLLVVVLFAAWRRGGVMAFTHYRDMDARGRDHQMGPLVDSLARGPWRLMEVTLVPLGPEILRNLAVKRRPFISYAAVLGPARCLSPGRDRTRLMTARTRVAGLLLRVLRPRVLFLVDESGSGQPLVRAARRLGIPTVGVQHGDFRPGNPQYQPVAGRDFAVQPADVLAVWSPWFRRRLLAISPIYGEDRVRITGRQRYQVESTRRAPRHPVRVLVLSEADPAFARCVAPYVTALEEAGLDVRIRHHPGEPAGARTPGPPAPEPGLAEALIGSDVVVGRSSSALLEALYHHRPVVVLAEDPARLAAEGLAEMCTDPDLLPALCRRLAGEEERSRAAAARTKVWGGAPRDPVQALQSCARCWP